MGLCFIELHGTISNDTFETLATHVAIFDPGYRLSLPVKLIHIIVSIKVKELSPRILALVQRCMKWRRAVTKDLKMEQSDIMPFARYVMYKYILLLLIDDLHLNLVSFISTRNSNIIKISRLLLIYF